MKLDLTPPNVGYVVNELTSVQRSVRVPGQDPGCVPCVSVRHRKIIDRDRAPFDLEKPYAMLPGGRKNVSIAVDLKLGGVSDGRKTSSERDVVLNMNLVYPTARSGGSGT